MHHFTGYELLWLFFIYSFGGWVLETVIATLKQRKFANRGLVNGPFCVIYGLILAIFSKGIISQFTKMDLDMIRVGTRSLRINGFSFMLFGFYTVYSSLLLALGKGLAGFFLGACRQGICFIPVILILPVFWGINGIMYAQPIADVLSAVITIFMAVHLHKELALSKQNFLSGQQNN